MKFGVMHLRGRFGHLLGASAAVTSLMACVQNAVAQASSPVTSSVFIQRAANTDSYAVNQNFEFIAHPPVQAVVASAPAATGGSHRGRRGQSTATSSSSSTSAALPLPQMPTDTSANGAMSQ